MALDVEQAALEWDSPLFRMALAQFEQGLEHADVEEDVAERLRYPERAVMMSVPVRRDDGLAAGAPRLSGAALDGARPDEGRPRYDPHVSLGECTALAMWMTWKCALLRFLRRREGRHPLQPARDVRWGAGADDPPLHDRAAARDRGRRGHPADMATNEKTMAWIMDTYSMVEGYAVPEIVTGKPISIGGSVFRREATGAGVVMVVERACRRLGWELAEQRCIVQGYGNVGGVAAHELAARGARVMAVSDISGGVYPRPDWTWPLWTAGSRSGSLDAYPDAQHVSNSDLLELPCDVLVLAALEDQITADNAGRIDAKMVAEGANGPTTVEADAILAERGIVVLPDILTNAGGVTVSTSSGCRISVGCSGEGRDPGQARRADR